MKRFIHIYLLILTSLFSDVYAFESKPLVDLKSHLAISINPNCNSQYVNYAIITESNGKVVKTRFISGSEFIRIGMGKQPSKANNSGENIFKKFQTFPEFDQKFPESSNTFQDIYRNGKTFHEIPKQSKLFIHFQQISLNFIKYQKSQYFFLKFQ